MLKDYADYDNALSSLTQMSREEILDWEDSKGFRSFGSIADSIYYSINPDDFKSVDEIYEFVKNNEKYIELITDEDRGGIMRS